MARQRLTFSRIDSTHAVQTNGLGSVAWRGGNVYTSRRGATRQLRSEPLVASITLASRTARGRLHSAAAPVNGALSEAPQQLTYIRWLVQRAALVVSVAGRAGHLCWPARSLDTVPASHAIEQDQVRTLVASQHWRIRVPQRRVACHRRFASALMAHADPPSPMPPMLYCSHEPTAHRSAAALPEVALPV